MKHPLRIGLVFDYNLSYPRGVLHGIRDFVSTRPHWQILHLDTDRLTEQELRAMQPDGIIGLIVYQHLAKALQSIGKPVVNVATILPDLPFPRVSTDHRQVAVLAANHLRERGFRHFGFVGHPHHVSSLEREAAFREALAPHCSSLACYHERPARSYTRRGRLLALNPHLQHWLRDLPKPAGIFAGNDLWGLAVVEACRFAGLRVPDDVAVIGVDNDELRCELARPPLSSIVVPTARVGFEAAALLERLLEGARAPAQPLLIPPVRVASRQSTDVLAASDPEVTAAVRFIREHLHRPTLSVGDVLKVVALSRRGLEQRFRKVLERGIGEEIRRVRVERVRDLLSSTSLPITEVAERAGFSSVHYMSRFFRLDVGLTPTDYRRQARNPR